MQNETRHLSSFRKCSVCNNEFYVKSATVCAGCRSRLANKKKAIKKKLNLIKKYPLYDLDDH